MFWEEAAEPRDRMFPVRAAACPSARSRHSKKKAFQWHHKKFRFSLQIVWELHPVPGVQHGAQTGQLPSAKDVLPKEFGVLKEREPLQIGIKIGPKRKQK